MKAHRLIFLTIILFSTTFVNAQLGPSIKFEIEKYDFKTILEDNGPVTYIFRFSNTGDIPLKLTGVRPGCGCTTSDWTKDEIAPGKKGFISATYDPKNRPGPFNKAISVESNDQKRPRIILFISGNVTPRKKTTIDFYPVRVGNLRFKTNHLAFMDIVSGSTKTDTMKLYNDWDTTMSIKLVNIPDFLTCKIIPKELKPKEEGVIVMSYNTKKKNDFGLIFDRFTMETNDEINTNKPLTVSAKIVEDFTELTPEQLKLAPKIKFDSKEYNFGTVKDGSGIKHSFYYTNLGQEDLSIRKVSPNAGCSVKSKGKAILKSGEKSQIDIVINTRGRTGKIHKTVTVITNDPLNPSIILSIIGTITAD